MRVVTRTGVPLKRALMALLLAHAACGSCGGHDPAPDEARGFVAATAAPRVLTERSFTRDPSLRLRPNDTSVFRLEAGAHAHDDTGEVGVDVIPLQIDQDIRYTFCLRDHGGHAHTASVADASGEVLGTVEEGDCTTVELAAGQHSLRLKSDGTGPATGELAFVRPVSGPDYRPRGHVAEVPASPPQTSPPGYSDPTDYYQIPADCTMVGPWNYDDAFCKTGKASWDASCSSLEADDCSARVADCKAIWGTEWDGTSRINAPQAWQACFGGDQTDYAEHISRYYPVMKGAGDRWVREYCDQIVANDCASEWSRSAGNRPACASTMVPYPASGALSLQPGQVAVLPQSMLTYARTSCPPEPGTLVAVLDASCADLGHRIGGVVLGPHTQGVLYPEADFGGRPFLESNPGESTADPFCLPLKGAPLANAPTFLALKHSSAPSVAVNRADGTQSDTCRAERMGLWCLADGQATNTDAVYAAHPDLDIAPPLPGELLLLGEPNLTVNGAQCAPALAIDTSCDDLSRLGFARRVYGVLRPCDDTFAQLFFSTQFAGKSTMIDADYRYSGGDDASRLQFQAMPDANRSRETGRGEANSVQLWRTWTYNHTVLISTGSCDECDLHGVDFTDEDLTGHSLVHSDLQGAKLVRANLTGADLGYANLAGADLEGATISGTRLGCATLTGIDTASPADSNKSSLVLGAPATWPLQFTVNGIGYQCTSTDLSGSKLPITLLPRDSWRAIRLDDATLLDLVDGYALDGLDLSGGSYRHLSMGNHALSIRGVNATGAALVGAALSRIDFGVLTRDGQRLHSQFAQADLRSANLSYTNLEEADLSGANLSPYDARSSATELSRAYMRNANLHGASMSQANLSHAYFYGSAAKVDEATLDGATFDGGVFSHLDFRGCDLQGASFVGAQAVGANFDSSATNLRSAKLDEASLQGARFGAAQLSGASFIGAHVSTAAGCWGYVDIACASDHVSYCATDLGTTDASNWCPSSERGPCAGTKLVAQNSTTEPIPQCVPDIFGNMDDCMTYEVLSENGDIPACTDQGQSVMTCGCLQDTTCQADPTCSQ
jgi:uncharacterized protein YjbI with pentapeptide repeats